MHTNVILTNKRRTHAQSNYTDTKLKAWFRRLLRHPARKRSGQTPGHIPDKWNPRSRLSTARWYHAHEKYTQKDPCDVGIQ